MKVRDFLFTIVGCTVMLAVALPKHLGFILIPFAFVVIYSMVKTLVFAVFNDTRKIQSSIKTLIWFFCFSGILTKHLILHFETREVADSVSKKIEDYHLIHGEYPQSIEDLSLKINGVDKIDLIYGKHQDKPFLTYPATWIGFDLYEFNFETKEWDYLSS